MKPETVELKVGKEILCGKLYLAEKPKNLAILFLHGWTGLPQDTGASVFANKGYTCMTFSLSGHGASTGKLSEQTHAKTLDEILAAYDFFAAKLSKSTKIGAAGNSYGGFFASILTSERPIDFIQMRVPANYPDERWNDKQLNQPDEVRDWRHNKLDPSATRSLRALHAFKGPVQIFEAELDERVPRQTIQNYVNAVKDKSKLDYVFMKGWPHSLGLNRGRNQTYQELTLKWLNKINEQI